MTQKMRKEPNIQQSAPILSTALLRVQEDKIIDQNGQKIYLRGFHGLVFYPIDFNLYMSAIHDKGLDPYAFDKYAIDLAQYTITDFDIQEIKSTGANTVRIWFNLDEIQKRPYEYSEDVLQLMESVINRFGSNGIYVIPVLGCAGQHDFECNEWYAKRNLSLWNKKTGLWDQSVKLWGVIANRFKSNPYIAGYDLINEPKAPSKQALHDYYQDIITEIRANDPNHILILEVDVAKEVEYQLGGNYEDKNIMASFHYYRPRDFTLNPDVSSLFYPGTYCAMESLNCTPHTWNKDNMRKEIETAINLPDLKDKPIYVGEFGAHALRDPDGLRWIEDMLTIMNENGMHYTYHNYRHRAFQGYWVMKPEVAKVLQSALQKLMNGELKYNQITEEQKQLLTTEKGFYQRPKIKALLTKYLVTN